MTNAKNAPRKGGRKPKTQEEKDAIANETKADKFRRLAKARLPGVIKGIGRIENLFASGYEWDEKQADTVIDLLKSAVKAVENKARKTKTDKSIEIDL